MPPEAGFMDKFASVPVLSAKAPPDAIMSNAAPPNPPALRNTPPRGVRVRRETVFDAHPDFFDTFILSPV
jgi:hypothetical protein